MARFSCLEASHTRMIVAPQNLCRYGRTSSAPRVLRRRRFRARKWMPAWRRFFVAPTRRASSMLRGSAPLWISCLVLGLQGCFGGNCNEVCSPLLGGIPPGGERCLCVDSDGEVFLPGGIPYPYDRSSAESLQIWAHLVCAEGVAEETPPDAEVNACVERILGDPARWSEGDAGK